MLGFGDVVGGYGMFGPGTVWGGGGLGMIRCWRWERGGLAFPSVTNLICVSRGTGSCPGLCVWHWVVAGSVRCAVCLAGHGVASCSVAGSRGARSPGLSGCCAHGMVLPVALT